MSFAEMHVCMTAVGMTSTLHRIQLDVQLPASQIAIPISAPGSFLTHLLGIVSPGWLMVAANFQADAVFGVDVSSYM